MSQTHDDTRATTLGGLAGSCGLEGFSRYQNIVHLKGNRLERKEGASLLHSQHFQARTEARTTPVAWQTLLRYGVNYCGLRVLVACQGVYPGGVLTRKPTRHP